jgi:hypothetical protein
MNVPGSRKNMCRGSASCLHHAATCRCCCCMSRMTKTVLPLQCGINGCLMIYCILRNSNLLYHRCWFANTMALLRQCQPPRQ